MRLAAELGLPVVTIVDTAGAATSRTAEEAGVASQIARCLADLMFLSTPVVSVLLGQGEGGELWRCCLPTASCVRGMRGCHRCLWKGRRRYGTDIPAMHRDSPRRRV